MIVELASCALRRRPPTLEYLLTGSAAFGLRTASPLQRAVCRIVDGRPLGELGMHPDVLEAIGRGIPEVKPKEIILVSGVRTAKSLTAGALAVSWTQTCDVSQLGKGEVPRVSVLSLSVDLARVVFGHIAGNVMSSPLLKRLVVGSPTADTITLRHPSGRSVEIKVVAGAKAGSSLAARWSAGAIFDEAPRMSGSDEAVVNYDDARNELRGRELPGAQIVSIGSPWAPFGPIYTAVQEGWKKPTAQRVVIWAPAWVMNPVWWTPERCESIKALDPDAWQTNCAAKFASPEENLFASVDLDKCTRALPLELQADELAEYVAAIDPGTRGNAWTLVVATRKGNRKIIVLARQWIGTRLEPLKPREVFAEMANVLKPYRVKGVYTDQWSVDALRDIASEFTLSLWERGWSLADMVSKWLSLKAKTTEGEIEFSPEPVLRSDLQRVKKRTTQNGVQIVLPKTSDGRHCDFAPATLLALGAWLDDARPPAPEAGTDEAIKAEAAAMRKALERKHAPKRRGFR